MQGMVKHIALIALALLFATPLAAKAQLPYAANPAAKDTPKTPPRDWKATNGKTLKAIATAYDGTTVTLLDAYRRKIPLPASRLVPDDIAYLEDFFPPPKPAHIPGQPSGPVKLTNGAAYIGYIPSSYNPRGKHPLLVYMGNEPAEENNVVRFQSALQAHKWCWIGIRPGIREQETETYHVLIQRCVKDAIAKMPVDPRRVYYCGTTSAAAQAHPHHPARPRRWRPPLQPLRTLERTPHPPPQRLRHRLPRH